MKIGNASRTAIGVARGLPFLAREEGLRSLLPLRSAELTETWLRQLGLMHRIEVALYRFAWFRRLLRWAERRILPGTYLRLAVRKAYVNDQVRSAIENGGKQVVVVGAGLDTLAARLALDFPSVTFIECDRPGTQAVKRRLLGALPKNLFAVPCDLGITSLDSALASTPVFDSSLVSIFVAEGVLMYLDEAEVIATLRAFCAMTPTDSVFVCTFIARDVDGTFRLGSTGQHLLARLERSGEPLRWGIRREALGEFLREQGLDLVECPDRESLRERYLLDRGLANEPFLPLEHLALVRNCAADEK